MLKNGFLILLLVINTILLQQNFFSIQSAENKAFEVALERMVLALQQKNSFQTGKVKAEFKLFYVNFGRRKSWKQKIDSLQKHIITINNLIYAPICLKKEKLAQQTDKLQPTLRKDNLPELLTISSNQYTQSINYQLILEFSLNDFVNGFTTRTIYFDAKHYPCPNFEKFFICEGDTLHLSYHPQRKSRIEHLYYEFVEASDTNVTHNLIETTLNIPTKGLLNQDETRKTITKTIKFAIYNHLTLDTLYDEKTIHFQVRKCE